MKTLILTIALLFVSAFISKAQTFDSVNIVTQFWMTKNLDVDHYLNGDVIPEVQDSTQWANLTTGAWCYYNNDPELGAVYGKLYNWYAINDTRGMAPKGWHIPSVSDWNTLEKNLGGYGAAGGKLKETDTIHWHYPNTGATNKTGFKGLPGGYRQEEGSFNKIGYEAWWWTSTDSNDTYAMTNYVNYMYTEILLNYSPKVNGYSVRCVSDYTVGVNDQFNQANELQVQEPYPNPFKSSATIEYSLPHAGNVIISVFTAQGQLLRNLVSGFEEAGNHLITWDGRNEPGSEVASGVYIYRIQFEGQCVAKKMFLVR